MRPSPRAASLPCLLLAAACLLAAPGSGAADPTPTPTPTPIPTLKLNDGRVLHNVQVRANQDDSIVVRADEGLMKVAKTNLPREIADAYPAKQAPAQPQAQTTGPDTVMQAFDANPSQQAPGQAQAPKPTPRPTPTPKPARSTVYKGCSIVSFQTKAFQTSLGCAEIVIRNDTDDVVVISPADIVCVTNTGVRHPGRIFVTDGIPPSIKRQEFVPARGDVDDIITFTNDALDISVVQWSR